MSRRPRARGVLAALGAVVAVAVGGLVLGACGIPTQRSATPIPGGHTQITLPATRPTVSPCTQSGCVSVDVYFIARTGLLAPAARFVPRDAKLATVIRSLLSGPTTAEQANGITTALGADVKLLSASVTTTRQTATLAFNTEFLTLSSTKEVLGIAQVVYTVTSVIPGAGVNFEIGSIPIEVPKATGALTATAVHESQYASLRTRVPTTTTTP